MVKFWSLLQKKEEIFKGLQMGWFIQEVETHFVCHFAWCIDRLVKKTGTTNICLFIGADLQKVSHGILCIIYFHIKWSKIEFSVSLETAECDC